MKNSTNITSFTYTITNIDDIISKEMEYKDYYKNKKNQENMLVYKHVVRDKDLYESFNRMHKTPEELNECIGSSRNKNRWFIHEYRNSTLSRKYDEDYDKIDFSGISKIIDLQSEGENMSKTSANKIKFIKDKID